MQPNTPSLRQLLLEKSVASTEKLIGLKLLSLHKMYQLRIALLMEHRALELGIKKEEISCLLTGDLWPIAGDLRKLEWFFKQELAPRNVPEPYASGLKFISTKTIAAALRNHYVGCRTKDGELVLFKTPFSTQLPLTGSTRGQQSETGQQQKEPT